MNITHYISTLSTNRLKHVKQLDTRLEKIVTKKSGIPTRRAIIRQQLRGAGLSGLDMLRPESFSVVRYLNKDENIRAAVIGREVKGGSVVMLVLTTERFIYFNQMPLFSSVEDVATSAVRSITELVSAFGIEIHLDLGNQQIIVDTHNKQAAQRFVQLLEQKLIDE
ncbi:MAG: hypothetical protein WA030_00685 [Candidatus Microsaccharimonas sp.]